VTVRRRMIRVSLMSCIAATLYCSLVHASETTLPIMEGTAAALVAADNGFGIDLYGQLVKGSKSNAFFSPYSIRTILTMTFAGARGKTAAQMASVLNLDDVPSPQLHSAFSSLIKSLNEGDKNYDLAIANALWGQSGFEFQKNFQDLLRTSYGAALHEVNFVQAAEPARLEINKWVEQQTDEKIKDLLAKGAVNDATCLVLTNAIYFKAAWDEPFRREQTKTEPFHLDASRDVQTSMMHHGTSTLKYFATDQFQAVELPYKGGQLSMVLIVPAAVDGLATVQKELTGDELKQWLAKMENTRVVLTMPKFTMSRELVFDKELKSMGMVDAFDRYRADFSGMVTLKQAETRSPYISQVIHKAFVDVDEFGTEAAAATAVAVATATAMRGPAPPPVVVTADRPYLFLIRHRDSGVILFLGQLVDPRG
jgi:serpin B